MNIDPIWFWCLLNFLGWVDLISRVLKWTIWLSLAHGYNIQRRYVLGVDHMRVERISWFSLHFNNADESVTVCFDVENNVLMNEIVFVALGGQFMVKCKGSEMIIMIISFLFVISLTVY